MTEEKTHLDTPKEFKMSEKEREYHREWRRKLPKEKKELRDKKAKEWLAKDKLLYPDKYKNHYTKYGKKWYDNNRDFALECSSKTRKNSRASHPEKYLLWGARDRAKAKGLPFSLELEDIHIPELCPVFKKPLKINEGGRSHNPYSPSLDKIIPSLGYVKGNVQVISLRANKMKSDASFEELKLFSDWIQNFTGVQ